MGHSSLAVIMKCFALFALASVALARPADEAVAPLVYGLPYGALAAPGYALPYAAPHVAYAHAPSSTTPLTLDSSTPLLSPMFTMPQAMSPTTPPLKPRLTSTTPLAMLKRTKIKSAKLSKKKKKKKKKRQNYQKKKKKKKKKS